ncbi:carbohydrate kinase [Micromonospora olivasterospora]|uniref:Fructokinase n=1 Tax=Micromonospora olivasterospora TaxID=1880 RepID=A0A562I394_MICOL|nr:carbohydrate kinase [Micromonospora olivasterospora]TWH65164.1 fructokinase [Micromonospora olivasterospora]
MSTEPGPAGGLLVVGEALVDVVHGRDGSVRRHPGGSPANVAVGLARLDRPVHLLTRTGDDPDGALVRGHLRAAGVRLVGGGVDGRRTATAAAFLDATGAARYEFDLHWELPGDPPLPEPILALHVGSVGAYLEPGAGAVGRIVRDLRGRATVSYDPNVRPALAADPGRARDRIAATVALSDVVKVSDEDLAWLRPGVAPEAVAAEWLASGPAVVVVTQGARGSFALSRDGVTRAPARPVTVVDTVGAGDAFTVVLLDTLASAGLLGAGQRAALREVDGPALRGVLDHAARLSAYVCARPGAQSPTRAELSAG